MPWGDGTGPWWGRGYGRRGFGRGLGYQMTGTPGWARGWPKGYCWQYFQQTGQFPAWSPWNSQNINTQDVAPTQDLAYLEVMKKSLEEQLKTLEDQINKLKESGEDK